MTVFLMFSGYKHHTFVLHTDNLDKTLGGEQHFYHNSPGQQRTILWFSLNKSLHSHLATRGHFKAFLKSFLGNVSVSNKLMIFYFEVFWPESSSFGLLTVDSLSGVRLCSDWSWSCLGLALCNTEHASMKFCLCIWYPSYEIMVDIKHYDHTLNIWF